MLFNQPEFILLFIALLIGLAVVKSPVLRRRMLLAASWYFYAYWDWRLLGLLIASTFVNYLIALGIGAAGSSVGRRKTLLVASVVYNLGLLGLFKYFNFFVESLGWILGPLGVRVGTLDIVLPIGISFYTFQAMAYVIDVHRGLIQPCRDFFNFALFIAFFPQLVAGPIVRATDLLPQLQLDVRLSWHDVFLGFRQFTIGLFKKLFIADRLAGFVDQVFANAGVFDGASTWLAVLAYGIQIYCDFSGYSDMAIGTARIMGYRLPENFDAPYVSTSITEFWRRWHITLSSWLRDYLYIPLGGSRKGRRRTYVNLLITMVLGGLWHGASWTFACWGTLHGLALAGDKWVHARLGSDRSCSPGGRLFGWLITMLIVFTGWVFFRAPSFHQAFLILDRMYVHPGGIAWYHPFAISVLVAMVVVHILVAADRLGLERLAPDRILSPVALFSMWWLVLAFPPEGFNPFVYFQF